MPSFSSSLVWKKQSLLQYIRVFNVLSVSSLRQLFLKFNSPELSKPSSCHLQTRTLHNISSSSNYFNDHEPDILRDEDKAEPSTGTKRQLGSFEKVKNLLSSLEPPWRRSYDCKHRFWARDILEDYLKLNDLSMREEFWENAKTKDCGRFLPTILVLFIQRTNSAGLWSDIDISIFKIASQTLQSKGLTWKDVEDWSYILSASGADEMTTRLGESCYQVQSFVLLYILNKEIHSVKSLEMLLLCTWGLVLDKKLTGRDSNPKFKNQLYFEHKEECKKNSDLEHNNSNFSQCDELDCSVQSLQYPNNDSMYIDLYTFNDLAKKLLAHSCRIWPASMVNVARMATAFSDMYVMRTSCDPQSLDPHTMRQLCFLINNLIVNLGNQSTAEPYLVIVYNWSSQKILLELAAKFRPAIILNQASYRAIINVLASHKKTENQREIMMRRARTWPPWYVAQHGMDNEELVAQEQSQVLLGIARLKEAGYSGDWFEDALGIVGGQEFDGTPTIQSRRMLPWPQSSNGPTDLDEMEPNLWAARVIATRDVHEAWAAFLQFKKKGGQPNQEMYLAMFQKLTFDIIRIERRRENNVIPGDGLEVLPVPENNYSDYYRRHLEPPCIEDLYSEMLRSGLKPKGRCLSFLVRNSRTPDQAIRYLRASGLGTDALESLGAFGNSISKCKDTTQVPLNIFSDYIYLICRFVPRLILVSPNSSKNDGQTEWAIYSLKTKSQFGAKLDQPLKLAAYLLSTRRPTILQPWYSFFRALSREKNIISMEYAGHPKNDILAWNVLRSSFHDFSSCGLHLNSRGFIMICHGFEKYIQAALKISKEEEEDKEEQSCIDEAHKFLKAEFRKLSENSCRLYQLPDMYQCIRGVLIHAYMRCLALVKDNEEILRTLEWMAQNSHYLKDVLSQESAYSEQKFRRVFIVVGVCLQGTRFEARARDIISGVDIWYGWPSADEIAEYQYNSPVEADLHT
ncbi:hypothetical protein OnM2_082033 [Erysiphe neolycopersici]|uniref:Uncharacterized protein n=1 Tax=Erysiphe neolycopersici TaxID=212602 RepID=A0A420HFN5_9PEZI|nr:hypothetical protein OnM2_082033 [Erysiphe neolycopersici]